MKLINFGSIVLLILCAWNEHSLSQTTTEERNNEVSSLSLDQEKFYQNLAETWAPLLFADSNIRTVETKDPKGQPQTSEILHPADAIVSPYFDGDQDWSNNPVNLMATVKDEHGHEKSKFSLKSQLLFSVIESKTHYYIAYTKYNALDIGPGAHGQDSEVVWTVVRKEEGKPSGVLEFVATNAHGFPKIYSPDAALEEKFRQAQRAAMSDKNKLIAEQVYIFDKQAFHHHKFGRPEFLKSETGEDRGMKVFVCQEGHALFKCNTEKWEAGYGKGYVYTCVPQGKEGEVQCYPILPEGERLIGYSLINQDKIMIDLYPRNEDSLSDDQKTALRARRIKLFEGGQNGNLTAEVSDGKLRLRSALPTEIVKGANDKKAEANLSNDWGLKTSFKLAVPHLIHRLLDSDDKDKISDEYIFNPYIEYETVTPKAKQSKSDSTTKVIHHAFCPRDRDTEFLPLRLLRSLHL